MDSTRHYLNGKENRKLRWRETIKKIADFSKNSLVFLNNCQWRLWLTTKFFACMEVFRKNWTTIEILKWFRGLPTFQTKAYFAICCGPTQRCSTRTTRKVNEALVTYSMKMWWLTSPRNSILIWSPVDIRCKRMGINSLRAGSWSLYSLQPIIVVNSTMMEQWWASTRP